VALNRTAIVVGAVVMPAVAAAWLICSRFSDKRKSVTPVTQAHNLSPSISERPPPVFAPHPVPAIARQLQLANTQNEFAADDAIVLRAADEHAARAEGSDADREFATTFRGLADRFAAEPSTDTGNKLRTEILNHLSEDAGPASMALQMECRQTICRVQLTGLEPDKSKTMEDIQDVGGFRQVIGMERPVGDGAMVSDVYLVMK
jgi:uncharacterized protein (DUF2267 family)